MKTVVLIVSEPLIILMSFCFIFKSVLSEIRSSCIKKVIEFI